MENFRLKNIIIMILLLLNLFLLLLVISHQSKLRESERALQESTLALLREGGIEIDRQLLRGRNAPPSCVLSRDEKKERAFASTLLGSETERGERGGATVYQSARGEAVFHANGLFTLRADDISSTQVESAAVFLKRACNYTVEDAQDVQGRSVIYATPYYGGLPIFEAQITFEFEGDSLRSVSGYFLPAADGETMGDATITKCSAAVALMDYCSDEGKIFESIEDISGGYLLQSTVSAPLLLRPVYRIDTKNTYSYYVNAITGHISPVK